MLTRRFPYHAAAIPTCSPYGEIDRVFNGFLSGLSADRSPATPALNVWQDDQHVFVEAEIPGFKMEQVNVNLTGRDLTIDGARETESSDGGDDKSWVRRKRSGGGFSRGIRLPIAVDAQSVTARLVDGVLTITLPKSPEAKPHKIAVT